MDWECHNTAGGCAVLPEITLSLKEVALSVGNPSSENSGPPTPPGVILPEKQAVPKSSSCGKQEPSAGFQAQEGVTLPEQKGEVPLNVHAKVFQPVHVQRPAKKKVGQVNFIDSSLYITGYIAGVQTSILVDTGAAYTIMSSQLWRDTMAAKLDPVEGSLVSATGEELQILGQATLPLRLGLREFLHSVMVVENLEHTCLLGADFLAENKCVINYDNKTLAIAGQELPLHHKQDQPRICRVVVDRPITVQPNTEMVFPGKLLKSAGVNEGSPGIVERKQGKNSLHIGRTLVVPKNGKVPVMVANVSDSAIHLRPNSTLGWFHPSCKTDARTHVFEVNAKPAVSKTNLQEVNLGQNNLTGVHSAADRSEHPPPKPVPIHREPRNPAELNLLLQQLDINRQELSDAQYSSVVELIRDFEDIFSRDEFDIGRSHLVQHNIETGDTPPIKQAPRRIPPHCLALVDDITKSLLERQLIQESQSPWSSPIVLAKKHDGSVRLCIDYRRINAHTVKSALPLPRVDDTLNALSGSRWFSSLDCASGYWQMEVNPDDRPKTSFVYGTKQYEWKVMPFGLTGAPASFTRLMTLVLGGLTHCLVYLDDVIVHAASFADHIDSLRRVFTNVREAGLKLKPSKCHLFQSSVGFLGHVVSENGVATDPEKINKIAEWPVPTDLSELRSFMGLATYYARFVPDFAKIASPLNQLTKKGVEFVWSDGCQQAFALLKSKLTSPPVLAYPDFSPDAGRFVLDTDASDFAIGAVLSQEQADGSEKVIAYGSKALHGGEENYCTTRREMLAFVTFAEHFRYYLLGKKFLCRTDNMALRWLLSFKEPSGQIARWLERLAEFDFDIEHRPGQNHGNADGVSRRPNRIRKHGNCPSCGPTGDTQEKTADIRQAQSRDPDLLPVIEQVKSGDAPTEEFLKGLSSVARAIMAQYSCLDLIEGCLYLRSPKEKYQESPRLVLPKDMIVPVLSQLHDGFSGAHLGQFKTELKVRKRVWRPGLKRLVVDYIRSCPTCQKCKAAPKRNKAPLKPIPIGRRFQRLHIDIIGPINPPSRRGHRYILVAQDAFSKWPEAWPLRNQKASTCARVLVSEYVARFGVPENIHSDQGTNFESNLFKEMCQILGIHKSRTTAYHPQGNGQVENFNKSLKAMLTATVEAEGRDWDRKLPSALMAFRASTQVSTGETPFLMNFGEEMRLPLDVMVGATGDPGPDMNNFVQDLREELEAAFWRARTNVGLAQKRQRAHYDTNMKNGSFKVGDLVLLRDHRIRPDEVSKFHRKWKGPYRILEKLNEVNYRVETVGQGRLRKSVVHLNNIKLYYSRDGTQPERIPDPLEETRSQAVSDSSESEDEVEFLRTDPRQSLRATSPAPSETEILKDDILSSDSLATDHCVDHLLGELESIPTLSVGEGSDHESEDQFPTEDLERPYNLRPRTNLKRPSRYINAAQLKEEDPERWEKILRMKPKWLRRARRGKVVGV